MEPTRELTDDIFREKVLRARTASADAKFFAGAEIFDHVCEVMRDGIRHQFPDADEHRVEQVLRERLAFQRHLERRA